MSYLTQLQTNNTNLQACIDKANTLPDASSGGGGNIETCTVTINFVGGAAGYGESQQAYVHFTNITECVAQTLTQDTTTIGNVIKNSLFIFYITDSFGMLGGVSISGGTIVIENESIQTGFAGALVCSITGSNVVITVG